MIFHLLKRGHAVKRADLRKSKLPLRSSRLRLEQRSMRFAARWVSAMLLLQVASKVWRLRAIGAEEAKAARGGEQQTEANSR